MIDNPPAFPRTGEGFGNAAYDTPGMSLRDWFAGQALVEFGGLISVDKPATLNTVVGLCYAMADAMLLERKKPSIHDKIGETK